MKQSRPAHVCFVAPYIESYLNPDSHRHVGGAERQQHLLAKRFRDAGHPVSFIAFQKDGPTSSRIDGFDLSRSLPRTNDLIHAPETLLRLAHDIRRIDADLYYVRGNPPLGILTSVSCSVLSKPLVYAIANDSNVELATLTKHHPVFRYNGAKLLYVDAIRRADLVIAQTAYQQRLLEKVFGIESRRIPNGYSLPPESHVRPASERSVVLWVGSLDPMQKHPERVIQLADRLPHVDFRIVGWSSNEAARQKIIEATAGRSNVAYEGYVPPGEIHRYYREAVALINTSDHEGFPNTFLEAWRFAVPVASLYFSLDDVLEENDIGAHAGSLDRMEEIVAEWWNDRDRAEEIGRNGRQYVNENYTMDVVFDRYSKVFESAMQ